MDPAAIFLCALALAAGIGAWWFEHRSSKDDNNTDEGGKETPASKKEK